MKLPESRPLSSCAVQVHNVVVRGRSHLNVSAIIKKLPNDTEMRVVVLRDDKTREKTAVKRLSHFPAVLDDVVKYNLYIRTVYMCMMMCFCAVLHVSMPVYNTT